MSNIKYYRVRLLSMLPVTSDNDGDLYYVKENEHLYVWDADDDAMHDITGASGGGTVTSGDLAAALAESEAYTDAKLDVINIIITAGP